MAVLSTTVLKFYIFVCVITVTLTKHVKHSKINVEKEEEIKEDKVYKEDVLINGIDRPYQLSYYQKNETFHILFFSYNLGRRNESTFEIGYVEVGRKHNGRFFAPTPVSEVENGFATAVNHKDHHIYLGGSNGIYVLNATLLDRNFEMPKKPLIPNRDILDLFYKDSLYFIEYPSRRLYKHDSGKTEKQEHIHEKLFNFVIDGEDDVFFSNKTGLYMIKKDSKHRIRIKGAKVFRAFEVNKKGVAYFCGQNEIYVADKDKYKLREVAKIKNIFGLTFDDDNNMIYSDPHQIVRLELEKKEEKTEKATDKDKKEEKTEQETDKDKKEEKVKDRKQT